MSDNITCFFIGGFGNNLFQLSQVRRLQSQGYSVTINLALCNRNIFTKILGWKIHSTDLIRQIFIKSDRIEERISFKQLVGLVMLFFQSKIFGKNSQVQELSSKRLGVICGYWQDGEEINDSVLEELKKCFFYSYPKQYKNVIHCRRGDFVEGQQLSLDYYVNAIALSGESNFLVVGDSDDFICDLAECVGEKIELTRRGESEVQTDFGDLAAAEVLIGSNSTFCFWASQIGPVNKFFAPAFVDGGRPWMWPVRNESFQLVGDIEMLFKGGR